MRQIPLVVCCLTLLAGPALAGPAEEQDGPQSPCVSPEDAPAETSAATQQGPAWGVELATSFSKQEALDQFADAKASYADLLGSYQPLIVTVCDLSLGTQLQYSARIGMDSREAADALCGKIRAAGGACIVQKN
jgi:hypothetical protein